jgi:hypothetical protein
MAAVLRQNGSDREVEYSFEIKLLGLRFRASGFLAEIGLIARRGICKAAQNPLIGSAQN